MFLPTIAVFLAVPTLEIETQIGQPDAMVEDNRAVANTLDLQIRALIEAANGGDAQAIETAATALLATANFLVEPLIEQDNADVLATLHALRGWSLWSLGRIEEADTAFDLAGPQNAREFGYLAFRHDLAWEQRDAVKALEILEADTAAAPGSDNLIIRYYDLRDLHGLRHGLDNDDVAEARLAEMLIASEWGTGSSPGALDWIYLLAMQGRHRAGDEEAAREALTKIRTPSFLLDILLDPEYSVYHVDIERQHGAGLAGAASSVGSDLAELWESRQGDAKYLLQYIINLRNRGQPNEIIERYAPIVDDLETAIERGETEHFLLNGNGFFVVNYLANAEMRLGRYDRAIARMDAILSLGLENHPDLINQAINRLDMLFQNSNYALGFDAAQSLEEADDEIVGPYGRMLIRAQAACASHQLGDTDVSRQWLGRLLAMDEPNATVILETHLCLNDLDAAEAVAVAELAGEDAPAMIRAFQELLLWQPIGDHDRMIDERQDALTDRPEMRRAIDAAGGIRQWDLANIDG
ncbi:MAG: hypothetical protein AAGE05_12470 [Pseudomonadota bacterium]